MEPTGSRHRRRQGLDSREAAIEWIEDHALNQRNLSREKRDTILARKVKRRKNQGETEKSDAAKGEIGHGVQSDEPLP